MMLYAWLHLTGEPSMTIEELQRFRQLGSLTPAHPEYRHTPGVEATTGPLGQGLGAAVGMALAERMLNAEFGRIVDHRTYVLASDGDLMEGTSQEAIAIAGHLQLGRLIVFYDDNHFSIDGPTSLSDSVDQVKRFQACNWDAVRVDGMTRPLSFAPFAGRRNHISRASLALAHPPARAHRRRMANRSGPKKWLVQGATSTGLTILLPFPNRFCFVGLAQGRQTRCEAP
jgi:hypothetical protein